MGDLNNDGVVNLLDYGYQVGDWLKVEAEQSGDLDRDGVVGLGDLWLLVNDWLMEKQL